MTPGGGRWPAFVNSAAAVVILLFNGLVVLAGTPQAINPHPMVVGAGALLTIGLAVGLPASLGCWRVAAATRAGVRVARCAFLASLGAAAAALFIIIQWRRIPVPVAGW